MEPVSADALKDGVYEVRVDSSSSMFRITECELTVQDGAMSAVMTMSGTGYLKLYMGTGAEAEQASEADFIPFVENADGEHTSGYRWKRWTRKLTAAPSAGKRKHGMTVCWYFVLAPFRQRLLPTVRRQRQRALSWKMVRIRVAVRLEGGSGRASVETPAALRVEDGNAFAVITWGSSNYDYMRLTGRGWI